MNFILNLVVTSLEEVGLSLLHNWPYLLVGIVMTAILKLYVDAEKISAFLRRFRGVGIFASTGVAVATPLCSCGTTAVVLGMMASTMPWAPIVAFMVASPLTSPEGLLYSAGLFGWPFAVTFFLSSIILGLAGGTAAALIENRGWLNNQARFAAITSDLEPEANYHPEASASGCNCDAQTLPSKVSAPVPVCSCSQLVPMYAADISVVPYNSLQPVSQCACETQAAATVWETPKPASALMSNERTRLISTVGMTEILKEIYNGGKRLLPMFLGFAFIGYFLNGLIPASWVATLFGSGNVYSVPLAATLGLPLYINGEASLPLVRALLDAGMSQGAALAFIISGAGTSIGAIAGALTIARWRVVALVVSILWIGAVLTGCVFDFLLMLRLF